MVLHHYFVFLINNNNLLNFSQKKILAKTNFEK